MLKVGITGGIGSGKSMVCQVFATLGIPVFNADDAARYLMEHDTTLIASIKQLLGNDVYRENTLDRERLGAVIFGDPAKLSALNAVVHPATIAYSTLWLESHTAPYAIKEAAILFESGSYKSLDVIIGVYAPQELRIARAMKRGGMAREKILGIIANQMNEDEKMKRCDHIITNDDTTAVSPQVLQLHELLVSQAATAS